MDIANVSTHNIDNKAEIIHPCLIPLFMMKNSVWLPLLVRLHCCDVYNHVIYFWKIGSKLK